MYTVGTHAADNTTDDCKAGSVAIKSHRLVLCKAVADKLSTDAQMHVLAVGMTD